MTNRLRPIQRNRLLSKLLAVPTYCFFLFFSFYQTNDFDSIAKLHVKNKSAIYNAEQY